MSIRFPESSVRATGRNTMGVRGIKLGKDDEVIGMIATYSDDTLLVVTENGFGKRSRMSDYRPQNRAGKGLITYRTTKRTGKLVGVAQVNDTDDVLLINDLGIIIRFRASEIPVLGRNTSGVTLMRSREGLVVDMSIVTGEDDQEHETVNGVPLPEDLNDEPLASEDGHEGDVAEKKSGEKNGL